MSSMPIIDNMEQAQRYAARASCGGCQKVGMLSAHAVQKEGPNQGRLFVKCRHCGSFRWLTAARTTDSELDRVQASARPCPKCGKRRDASRVSKDGPNKGRLFLVCADPACDSFEWASPPTNPEPAPAPRPVVPVRERTEEGFLTDIRDNPEDDAIRLIFADWLDEHDQPARAELIRVQIERDRLAMDEPDWVKLNERARAILAEHAQTWTAPIRPFVRSCKFVRGLLDEVEIEVGSFVEHADELLRTAATAEFRAPVLGWLGVRALTACKRLQQVRRLTLLRGERLGRAGARILAESPNIANLKSLSLADQSLGLPGVQALAGSRYLKNLEVLDLSQNNLSTSAIPVLVSSTNLPRLRRLILANNLLQDCDVRALSNAPYLQELRELDLSGNAITSEGVEALVRSPMLARLRRLNLSDTQIGQRGVFLLWQSPRAGKELDLKA